MTISIEEGKLKISVVELLECLSPDEKRALVDTLSCEDDLIEDIANQIVNGWTAAGSHGGRCWGDADPGTPLDKAIRKVAISAGTVASKEVESLCASLRRQHAYHKQVEKWAWDMYHGWGKSASPPSMPSAYDSTPDEWAVVLKEANDDRT